MKIKIVVTGGEGRFASLLKNIKTNYNILFPSKKTLDITNYNILKIFNNSFWWPFITLFIKRFKYKKIASKDLLFPMIG